MPQLSAVMEIVKEAKDIPVISDGGVRYSGDVVVAIGAGASTVMLGSILLELKKLLVKLNSIKAEVLKHTEAWAQLSYVKRTDANRYMQGEDIDADKLVPEGIEGRVPFRGWLKDMLTS